MRGPVLRIASLWLRIASMRSRAHCCTKQPAATAADAIRWLTQWIRSNRCAATLARTMLLCSAYAESWQSLQC